RSSTRRAAPRSSPIPSGTCRTPSRSLRWSTSSTSMASRSSIPRTRASRSSSCSSSAVTAASLRPAPRTFTARTTSCSTPSSAIRRTTSASRSCRLGPPETGRARGARSHRLGGLGRRDQLALLEQRQDLRRVLLRRVVLGVENDLGVERRLVWIRDAGELLDLALEGLLVQALHVALRADLDRCLDEDLDEPVAHQLARLVADLAVGGDGGGDHRDAVPGEQVGDEGDPANVRVAVLLGEPEALGEVLADHVAVEHLDPRTPIAQLALDDLRDGRLARAREPGEPEREAFFVSHCLPLCMSRSGSEPPRGGCTPPAATRRC